LDFSEALKELKMGTRISREGWNGKGMYIVYKPGYPSGIGANKASAKAHRIEEGEEIKYGPFLEIFSANGTVYPWVPSSQDLLAEDWNAYELVLMGDK
jgi:hypothetical protein